MKDDNNQTEVLGNPAQELSEMLTKGSDDTSTQGDVQTNNTEGEGQTQVVNNEDTTSKLDFSKPPTRFENENDYSYNSRVDMWSLTRAKEEATTEEEKTALDLRLKGIRGNLGKNSGNSEQPIQQVKATPTEDDLTTDEWTAVQQMLRDNGFATKDDIASIKEQAIAEARKALQIEQAQREHDAVISNFLKERPEIASNREVFDSLKNFVGTHFVINEETTPKMLGVYLNMAANELTKTTNSSFNSPKIANPDVFNVNGSQAATPKQGRGLTEEQVRQAAAAGIVFKNNFDYED